jgi:hypothetical protein
MASSTRGNLLRPPRISRIDVKPAIFIIVLSAAVQAQIYPPGGGYPGGGYPGGGYPGGGYPGSPYPGGRPQTGPSIPMPGGRKPKESKTANQPLPNFRGTLKQMDEKSISLELGDNRILDFKRNDKTKFFKSGSEIKTPKFDLGDQISVEASEDPSGYMTAVNVYWEKAAGGATTSSKDGTYDTWKDNPGSSQGGAKDDPDRPVLRRADSAQSKDAPKASSTDAKPSTESKPNSAEDSAPPRRESATEVAPPPARRDAEDPGPPVLKRGGAADPARERGRQNYPDTPQTSAPQQVASNGGAPAGARPSVIRGDNDEDTSMRGIERRPDDPLIRRAADAALEFTQGLPSYVTTEAITRYQSETTPANFHALDVITTEVVYENGREDYRNLTINGKKSTKSMEDSGGAWSTGEFGTVLINLFSPATSAKFHFRRDSRAANVMAKMYDFEVDHEHSGWSIHMGAQSYLPAYTGSVWIDPQTARVLRIEMEGKGLPDNFPIDHVESATDYSYVRLGDAQQYLLPVHAENLSCQRGTQYCSRNVIDFRNYHKYTGESNIKFGGETKEEKKQ